MFDPTAFDNMKVVIEGAAYDLDLSGEIKIIDRKDLIDLATMSRTYQLKLCLSKNKDMPHALFTLIAGTDQLASEILSIHSLKQGAYVSLSFSWKESEGSNEKYDLIRQLWGNHRTYDERKTISSLYGVNKEVIIEFNRIVTEDMLDDLLDMLHHTVKTLHKMMPNS